MSFPVCSYLTEEEFGFLSLVVILLLSVYFCVVVPLHGGAMS